MKGHEMKVNIRFQPDSHQDDDFLTGFCQSLTIDPGLWLDNQQALCPPDGMCNCFGMAVPLPQAVRQSDKWSCRLTRKSTPKGTAIAFAVNGIPLACSTDLNDCRELLALMPHDFRGLHIATGTGDIAHLESLAKLSGLNSLELSGATALTDITPLSALTHLRELMLISFCSLADIGPLATLASLSKLVLWEAKLLQDIRPLAKLANLNELRLIMCQSLVDIQPLSGLRSLRILELSGAPLLTDITPLEGLDNLTELNLRCCRSLSPKVNTLETKV